MSTGGKRESHNSSLTSIEGIQTPPTASDSLIALILTLVQVFTVEEMEANCALFIIFLVYLVDSLFPSCVSVKHCGVLVMHGNQVHIHMQQNGQPHS